jgi:protein-disulfide isomerase
MASRKEQKEQARQRRLAEEQAQAERALRARRLRTVGGVAVVAVAVIALVIAISSSSGTTAVKPHSKQARAAVAHVDTLLGGIPESGNTLGKASAPITVIEYGDLECSLCDVLATPASVTNAEGEAGTGWEDDRIEQYVRTGRAKLVYRSLETASSGNPNPDAFALQQAAAVAAGLQRKAWYYIELFYNEQGAEGAGYVTDGYLEGLARQIHRLNFSEWMADRNLTSVKNQVSSDNAAGSRVDGGNAGTPTLVIRGPAGTKTLPSGLPSSYGELQASIKSVD